MGTTMAKPSTGSAPDSVRHAGPPLILPGVVFMGLFVSSLVGWAVMTGGAPYPRPFGDAGDVRSFAEHATAVRVMAFLQFGAAIPLGIFTATLASRFRFLGVEVAGVSIALFGGIAASIFLAVSALTQWVLGSPGVADGASDARLLQLLAFASGGPGHVVPLGLLLVGASITGGVTRLLPRWLMWFGIVLAAFAELSTLTLILEPAAFLLPLARFPAFIWILCVAVMLPSRRSVSSPALRAGETVEGRLKA
jgi:hypothetical protein